MPPLRPQLSQEQMWKNRNPLLSYHVDSKKILTIQHGEEVGPGGVLCLFGVVKEDVHPLMVLLRDS